MKTLIRFPKTLHLEEFKHGLGYMIAFDVKWIEDGDFKNVLFFGEDDTYYLEQLLEEFPDNHTPFPCFILSVKLQLHSYMIINGQLNKEPIPLPDHLKEEFYKPPKLTIHRFKELYKKIAIIEETEDMVVDGFTAIYTDELVDSYVARKKVEMNTRKYLKMEGNPSVYDKDGINS